MDWLLLSARCKMLDGFQFFSSSNNPFLHARCHWRIIRIMDRGRVGYNKVGNKTLRENHIKHVRLVHLERLRKIRTRIPGSSSTLDNQLPRNAGKDSQSLNPRKASLKREHNRVVLRQNKYRFKYHCQLFSPFLNKYEPNKDFLLSLSLRHLQSFAPKNQQYFDGTTSHY